MTNALGSTIGGTDRALSPLAAGTGAGTAAGASPAAGAGEVAGTGCIEPFMTPPLQQSLQPELEQQSLL